MDDEGGRGEALRAFLAEHDEPCPACGYNLRGLTGEACPECGEELVLRVGMAEPRIGLFVAGFLGLAVGAGFHGMITVLRIIGVLLLGRGYTSRAWFELVFVGAVFAVGCMLIAVWVRQRGRVRRCSKRAQLALVIAAWGYSVFTLVAFVVISLY